MKIVLPICVFAMGCVSTTLAPSTVRVGEDACAQCRMTLVSTRTAAQIVSPGEEPVIFDELGCLREYLSGHELPAGARIFVADHRSGAWLNADAAVFTKTSVSTPMASGLMAYADPSSRDADTDARNGEPVTAAWLLHPREVSR